MWSGLKDMESLWTWPIYNDSCDRLSYPALCEHDVIADLNLSQIDAKCQRLDDHFRH